MLLSLPDFLLITVSTIIELAICIISMRGSILDTSPRVSMKYWLYIRLSMFKLKILANCSILSHALFPGSYDVSGHRLVSSGHHLVKRILYYLSPE